VIQRFPFYSLALVALILVSCGEEVDKAYKMAVVKERSDKNMEFALDKGPLDETTRLDFTGLSYYPILQEYLVQGEFVPLQQAQTVLLEQGDTMKQMLKYGHAHFSVNGEKCSLLVYKPLPDPLMDQKDYMFIPFFDKSNGSETYEGGRYVYPVFNDAGDLEIDFNRASNPYCAYNHSFNCIVPPAENTLNFEIKAGEKSFH